MWRNHDCPCKSYCSGDDVEIRFQMFLRYFVAQILNRSHCDVPAHVCADVCSILVGVSDGEVQTVTSTSKNETLVRAIPLRQRSSTLGGLHPVTTSTRIPLLSP